MSPRQQQKRTMQNTTTRVTRIINRIRMTTIHHHDAPVWACFFSPGATKTKQLVFLRYVSGQTDKLIAMTARIHHHNVLHWLCFFSPGAIPHMTDTCSLSWEIFKCYNNPFTTNCITAGRRSSMTHVSRYQIKHSFSQTLRLWPAYPAYDLMALYIGVTSYGALGHVPPLELGHVKKIGSFYDNNKH